MIMIWQLYSDTTGSSSSFFAFQLLLLNGQLNFYFFIFYFGSVLIFNHDIFNQYLEIKSKFLVGPYSQKVETSLFLNSSPFLPKYTSKCSLLFQQTVFSLYFRPYLDKCFIFELCENKLSRNSLLGTVKKEIYTYQYETMKMS